MARGLRGATLRGKTVRRRQPRCLVNPGRDISLGKPQTVVMRHSDSIRWYTSRAKVVKIPCLR